MLIIIEGCDGAGKSTLADKIDHALPLGSTEVRHCGPLKQHPLNEYELPLSSYAPTGDSHVIYDRHFVGEDVYGPLYRQGSRLTPCERWHITMFLQSRGAFLVHVTNHVEELVRRNRERKESFLNEDDTATVCRRFAEELTRIGLALPVNSYRDPTDFDVDQTIDLAAEQESLAAPLAQFPTYIGPTNPRLLLFGERRGPLQSDQAYPAAFVPYASTSGAYLLDALIAAGGIGPRDLGIANALEEDCGALLEVLGNPRVVSLGILAHRKLIELGISHGAVPHPQWVRRFKHSLGMRYGTLIQRAASEQKALLGEGAL